VERGALVSSIRGFIIDCVLVILKIWMASHRAMASAGPHSVWALQSILASETRSVTGTALAGRAVVTASATHAAGRVRSARRRRR